MEEKSLLQEIGGGAKRQESILQVLKARRLLKRRYGKIYIRFNQPFSLNEFLSEAAQAEKDTNRNLAFHLIEAINQVSLVTPLALVATAILANHRRGFQLSDLVETAKLLLGFVIKHGFPTAGTLADPEKAVQETLSLLVNWKAVDFLEDVERKEETFYYVEDDKKVELEYYKNNIIHFFIPHAFVAISLLSGTEEVKDLDSIMSDYVFLRDLFRKEFVFDEREDLRERLIPIIEDFRDSGYLMPAGEDGGYKIAKLGFDKLPIWAALAKTFLESYWIVTKSIGKERHKRVKKGDALKSADYLGRRFHKLGLVEHSGALSRLNYQNAMSVIQETVLSLPDSSQEDLVLERLSQLGQRLYELSHYRS
jgi:glycerol-3-phosphate O-acyltransferase